MGPEAKNRLEDILESIARIDEYTNGKTFADYEQEAMLRDAVERRFELIGEAMRSLDELKDDSTAGDITNYKRIIGFRVVLAHRPHRVENDLVWSFIEGELPILRKEVEALLREG